MKKSTEPRIGPVAGLVIWCIKGYQTVLSPCLPRACRFWPSCSEYAIGAVRTHGLAAGMLLGMWRILRCNPWNAGGVDPVPERLPAWFARAGLAGGREQAGADGPQRSGMPDAPATPDVAGTPGAAMQAADGRRG